MDLSLTWGRPGAYGNLARRQTGHSARKVFKYFEGAIQRIIIAHLKITSFRFSRFPEILFRKQPSFFLHLASHKYDDIDENKSVFYLPVFFMFVGVEPPALGRMLAQISIIRAHFASAAQFFPAKKKTQKC